MQRAQARKRFLAGWQRIKGLCKEWEEINEASRSPFDAALACPRNSAMFDLNRKCRSEATGIVNAILELEHLEVLSTIPLALSSAESVQ